MPPPRLGDPLDDAFEEEGSLPDNFENSDVFDLPPPVLCLLFRKASSRFTLSLHCNSIS